MNEFYNNKNKKQTFNSNRERENRSATRRKEINFRDSQNTTISDEVRRGRYNGLHKNFYGILAETVFLISFMSLGLKSFGLLVSSAYKDIDKMSLLNTL